MHGTHSFKWGVEIRLNKRRHHFRHQSQRRLQLRRRHGVFSSADHVRQWHARHSTRRSASRLTHRPADRHAVFLLRHRRGQRHSQRRQVRRSCGPPRSLQLLFSGCLEDLAAMDTELRLALRSKQPHPGSQASHINRRIRSARTANPLPSSPPAPRRFFSTIRSPFIPWIGTAWVRASRSTTPSLPTPCSMPAARSPRILPNLWQDNFLTGGIPFVFQPLRHRSAWNPCSFFQHRLCPSPCPSLTPSAGNFSSPMATVRRWQPTRKWICSDSRTILRR